jgi:sec-independent protein translocase protein TatA
MPEIVIIPVTVLVLFGPSRLPGLGKGIGEAIGGFKRAFAAK